jgi:hypothetical protein
LIRHGTSRFIALLSRILQKEHDMEVTPRAKSLVTAIAIGLGSIVLIIVLSMIR